jgi:hypothetical protein
MNEIERPLQDVASESEGRLLKFLLPALVIAGAVAAPIR